MTLVVATKHRAPVDLLCFCWYGFHSLANIIFSRSICYILTHHRFSQDHRESKNFVFLCKFTSYNCYISLYLLQRLFFFNTLLQNFLIYNLFPTWTTLDVCVHSLIILKNDVSSLLWNLKLTWRNTANFMYRYVSFESNPISYRFLLK